MTRPALADGTDHTRLRTLRVGCEKFIADAEWDHFCTLTFRFEVTEADGVVEFEQRYVQRLQQRSQGRVNYFAVAARNSTHGRVHVHALLRCVHPLGPSEAAAAWKAGQSLVRRFDPCRGAGRYIASHVALSDAEIMWR